jgi:hypothetical protein
MDPLNLLKSLFKLEGTIKPTIQALKPGQIIVGKIIKLFPNQTAEIQIGSQKLIARLEIPLLANQQYWFQVQMEEGKVRLKMIKRNNDSQNQTKEWQTAVTYKDPLEQTRDSFVQYLTQIPVPIGNRTYDLSLQWSGKKTKDGKMDPNDCRILFSLNLDTIGETFIDLHIKNRSISISVINENSDLQMVSSSLIHPLKEKLAKMDYQVSSLSFERSSEILNVKNDRFPLVERRSYEGVDFRV